MKKAALQQFATALKSLGTAGDKTENLAAKLLAVVKSQQVRTSADLDATVKGAYGLNGWNTRQGRPSAEKRAKVPNTVRTYVWELRSAMRDGIPIWQFKNFYELRLARGKVKAKADRKAGNAGNAGPSLPDLPELVGVRVASADTPNGALFHDLVICFAVIPEGQRALLARNLNRLLHRYQLAAPAPAVSRKKKATG